MEFIPVKMIYTAIVQGHTLVAQVHYFESYRSFDFFFNDKSVSSKVIQNDEGTIYKKDDEAIDEMIKEYCKNNKDLFTDIFVRHADKVKLKSKEVEVILREGFIEMTVNFLVKKNKYIVTANTKDDENKFICEIAAKNFSEVFEKIRLFSATLGKANEKLVKYIDSFAHDNIKDSYDWY